LEMRGLVFAERLVSKSAGYSRTDYLTCHPAS